MCSSDVVSLPGEPTRKPLVSTTEPLTVAGAHASVNKSRERDVVRAEVYSWMEASIISPDDNHFSSEKHQTTSKWTVVDEYIQRSAQSNEYVFVEKLHATFQADKDAAESNRKGAEATISPKKFTFEEKLSCYYQQTNGFVFIA